MRAAGRTPICLGSLRPAWATRREGAQYTGTLGGAAVLGLVCLRLVLRRPAAAPEAAAAPERATTHACEERSYEGRFDPRTVLRLSMCSA